MHQERQQASKEGCVTRPGCQDPALWEWSGSGCYECDHSAAAYTYAAAATTVPVAAVAATAAVVIKSLTSGRIIPIEGWPTSLPASPAVRIGTQCCEVRSEVFLYCQCHAWGLHLSPLLPTWDTH